MRRFLTITLIFCCSLGIAQSNPYSVEHISPELLVDAHAVFRADEIHIDIAGRKNLKITAKQVVTVLKEDGNKLVRASVGYDNSSKIQEVYAIIYDASGKEIKKVKSKEFKDVSAVANGTLYSDSRVMYLDYTPISYPYTVEFVYKKVTDNTLFVPSWFFIPSYRLSIEKSHYEVNFAEPSLKPEILELNLVDKIRKEENANSLIYTASGLEAIKSEPLAPPLSEWAPRLMVRPGYFHYEGHDGVIGSWKELGLWMHKNLLEGRRDLPAHTAQEIRRITAGIEDPIAKAKKVYDFVQNNTRYISVQVGLGGLQPISASEVDQMRYGDCKGLTNYTMALLDAVGVPSYYTHVQAGNQKVDFKEEFADLSQGNHVILAIPVDDSYAWIDCTSQQSPFGFLGDFTDDRLVHVIKPDGGEIIRTPTYLNDKNYQLTLGEVTLLDSGDIKGKVSICTEGIQYDDHLRLVRMPYDEKEKYYKRYWSYINNLKIKEVAITNDKNAVQLSEKINFEANKYTSISGDAIFLKPNVLNRNSFIPDRVRNRKLPFKISRGYKDQDSVVINIPDGYTISAIPENQSIRSEFGTYDLQLDNDADNNKLVYRRTLSIQAGTYPATKYKEYRSFRRKISKSENAKIIIETN